LVQPSPELVQLIRRSVIGVSVCKYMNMLNIVHCFQTYASVQCNVQWCTGLPWM